MRESTTWIIIMSYISSATDVEALLVRSRRPPASLLPLSIRLPAVVTVSWLAQPRPRQRRAPRGVTSCASARVDHAVADGAPGKSATPLTNLVPSSPLKSFMLT